MTVAVHDIGVNASSMRVFARNRASVVGLAIILVLVIIAILGDVIAPYDPMRSGQAERLQAPSLHHLMGTDDLGRDVFSRVCAAIRTSLMVGFIVTLISTVIAVVVGGTAGFFGGLLDDVMMRVTELFQVIPRFFLAIVLVAFFSASLLNIIVSIALLSWPEVARIVRAEFLTLKSRQFVAAAEISGRGNAGLIFLEILPNAMGPVIVNATLQIGQAILLEAGLSYLGLGDPRAISLGLMLYQAQETMRAAWWAATFPGLVIFLAVLSVNIVGDGLNDIFNPRSKSR